MALYRKLLFLPGNNFHSIVLVQEIVYAIIFHLFLEALKQLEILYFQSGTLNQQLAIGIIQSHLLP